MLSLHDVLLFLYRIKLSKQATSQTFIDGKICIVETML